MQTLDRLSRFYNEKKQKAFLGEILSLLAEQDLITTAAYKLGIKKEELISKLKEKTQILDYEVLISLHILGVQYSVSPANTHHSLFEELNKTHLLGPYLMEDWESKHTKIFDLLYEPYQENEFYKVAKDNSIAEHTNALYHKISSFIVGQDAAIKDVLTSWKLFETVSDMNASSKTKLKKPSLLLQGETGSGKTYILQTLAQELGIPLVVYDASNITAPGYVGEDVSDLAEKIADVMMEHQSTMIVLIDEIDKLTTNGSSDHREFMKSAQTGLLKFLEERYYRFKTATYSKNQHSGTILDLSSVMFVFAGSFHNYLHNKQEFEVKHPIGFENKAVIESDKPLTEEDLIKAGLVPELVGRIGRVVKLRSLDEGDFKNILTKSQNNPLEQYDILGKHLGIDTSFTNAEIDGIVKESFKLKLGARGLKGKAEQLFLDKFSKHMYK
jgi:ATP-dependent Clp protease ATP-binding subunit ClpX